MLARTAAIFLVSLAQLNTLALARKGGLCNIAAAPRDRKQDLLVAWCHSQLFCFLAGTTLCGSVRGKTEAHTPEGSSPPSWLHSGLESLLLPSTSWALLAEVLP